MHIEVYIERHKSVHLEAAPWSDYKHHNTLKFLIDISPSGFIIFVSDSYGGRTSDVYICKDSNFYGLLEREDEIMADRGFQINEELLLRFRQFYVPHGARAKSQLTPSECKRTKKVTNLRIRDDVIRDLNNSPNCENDNNKGKTQNKELKLGIQTNFGKEEVMLHPLTTSLGIPSKIEAKVHTMLTTSEFNGMRG